MRGKKDIIVRGGFNISTQEVENAILAHPKIAEVAVVGYPDEVLGERGCAFVVPVKGETVTLDELCTFLEEMGLAKYKFPEKLKIIDSLPRNPVGKILKRELKKTCELNYNKGPWKIPRPLTRVKSVLEQIC